MITLAAQIARLIGADAADTLDEVWAPGYWFRVQPAGLGLDHRSECSDGSLAAGVHVFQTLAQAVLQEGAWQMAGYELVVIEGPEILADTRDVEGWLLLAGEGRIISRFDFAALCDTEDN